MKIFKLPDLGEGLADAVIRQWHIAEGDSVVLDQPLVSVETAKALVEIPAPWAGKIKKLYVAEGDTLESGQPLVEFFASKGQGAKRKVVASNKDAGTVVGNIQQTSQSLHPEPVAVALTARIASPRVRALARRLGVDLTRLQPQGSRFSEQEVYAAGEQRAFAIVVPEVSPVRRAMALTMRRSHEQVTPVTLCDEVDISAWWGSAAVTLKLLRALQLAAKVESCLNATYSNGCLVPSAEVNIGLAVDSTQGLFVPVLKDVAAVTDEQLLQTVKTFKQQAAEGAIPQQYLHGASILLSNFGNMAGRFATPVVVPPTVAIVAAGRIYDGVVAVNGVAVVRKLLPLSVSADHRAVTGGELARFLKALGEALN